MVTETVHFPKNFKPVDLQPAGNEPGFYQVIQHITGALQQVPRVRPLAYFKMQMLRNEIVDVT